MDKFPTLPWFEMSEAVDTYGIDENLLAAIIVIESGVNQFACRYEPNWNYYLSAKEYALKVGSTLDTELIMQATSFGYVQIMGTVARELGFEGWLPELFDPKLNIFYGAKKLDKLFERFHKVEEVIAAYNAGTPKRGPQDLFINQPYVDKVLTAYETLRNEG